MFGNRKYLSENTELDYYRIMTPITGLVLRVVLIARYSKTSIRY